MDVSRGSRWLLAGAIMLVAYAVTRARKRFRSLAGSSLIGLVARLDRLGDDLARKSPAPWYLAFNLAADRDHGGSDLLPQLLVPVVAV